MDVDSTMLSDAADEVAKRQKSGKRPKTYADYRTLLKKNDLDLVLIATDHWHALPMIDAVKSGCDVYVQKPTSIDVVESQAMLAAARKYDRVVQVGTQRRSNSHLMEAKEKIVDAGLLGNIAHTEVCYYHMRNRSSPDAPAPENLDYEMWTGPAPMRAYNKLCHPGLARVHGVQQRDRRRHVHSHARHGALDARPRLADERGFAGRHPCRQTGQGQHDRHSDRLFGFRRPAGGLAAPRVGTRA